MQIINESVRRIDETLRDLFPAMSEDDSPTINRH
jgi:hypothetical protein